MNSIKVTQQDIYKLTFTNYDSSAGDDKLQIEDPENPGMLKTVNAELTCALGSSDNSLWKKGCTLSLSSAGVSCTCDSIDGSLVKLMAEPIDSDAADSNDEGFNPLRRPTTNSFNKDTVVKVDAPGSNKVMISIIAIGILIFLVTVVGLYCIFRHKRNAKSAR